MRFRSFARILSFSLLIFGNALFSHAQGIAFFDDNPEQNLRLVQMAITQRLDINQKNNEGTTRLMYAAYKGQSKVVDLLLLHSANPNLQNYEGNTALMAACHGGHTEIARNLIKHHRLAVEEFLDENREQLPAIAVRETAQKLKTGRKSVKKL